MRFNKIIGFGIMILLVLTGMAIAQNSFTGTGGSIFNLNITRSYTANWQGYFGFVNLGSYGYNESTQWKTQNPTGGSIEFTAGTTTPHAGHLLISNSSAVPDIGGLTAGSTTVLDAVISEEYDKASLVFGDVSNYTISGNLIQNAPTAYLYQNNTASQAFQEVLLNDNGNVLFATPLYLTPISSYNGTDVAYQYIIPQVSGYTYTVYTFLENSLPYFNHSLVDQSVLEDSLFVYDINCTDADLDVLTYFDDSALFDINSTEGIIGFTPTNSEVGSYVVTINCQDIDMNVSESFVLEINNTNDAPVVSGVEVSPSTAYTADDLTVSFNASDEDPGEYLLHANVTWFNGTTNVNSNDTMSYPVLLGGPYDNKLLISEVNYDDDVSDQNEYVELFNPTSQPITINTSWSLGDGEGNDSLCDAVIPPGGHYLVADDGGIYAGMADCTTAAIGTGLSNTADSVRLYNADGILVDGVGWGGETVEGTSAADVTDVPLIRTIEYVDSDDNSADFSAGVKNPQSTTGGIVSLDSSITNKGESWTAQVTLFDAYGGEDVANSTVVIQNTVPSATGVNITPSPAYEDSDLTGNYVFADADNDADSSTYKWYVNGAEVVGETTTSLSSGNFSQGDNVVFEVTPNDGTASGSVLNSSAELINSIPPVVTINLPTTGNYTSQTIAANITTNELATCTYSLNNTATGTISSVLATEHIGTINTQGDGSLNLTVLCDDAFASTGQSSVIVNVDTLPPVITINSPVNQLYDTANITIDVSTNEVADCNYSVNSGADQVLFAGAASGSTSFLASHGSNTVDVTCADVLLQTSTDSVSFTTDIEVPADITDLTAGVLSDSEVQLNWTAPGDDNVTGSATSYMLRQSTAPINTLVEFNAATPVTGSDAITPSAAGSAESFTASGLVAGTPYYFAILATDDVGHNSSLVNNVTATPVSHDVAVNSVTHDKVGSTIYVGDSVQFTANVSNDGTLSESVNVTLKENGAVVESTTVVIAGGASQDVVLSYTGVEGTGKSFSVEVSIDEAETDYSDNSQSMTDAVWSVANNFNLTWVDAVDYPNANEAAGNFYVWARIENLDVNSFNDFTVTMDPDGLSIASDQDGGSSATKTYATISSYGMETYYWEVTGVPGTYDISVNIGNSGDDITIARQVVVV